MENARTIFRCENFTRFSRVSMFDSENNECFGDSFYGSGTSKTNLEQGRQNRYLL